MGLDEKEVKESKAKEESKIKNYLTKLKTRTKAKLTISFIKFLEKNRLAGKILKKGKVIERLKGSEDELVPSLVNALEQIFDSKRASEMALECLYALVSKKDFDVEWIDKYWNPIFDVIIKNTHGWTTYVFWALNTILNHPSFKKEWLTEGLAIRLLELCNTIAENTSGLATGNAFNHLGEILNNKNLSKDLLPILQKIAENTSEGTTGNAFNHLGEILKNKNFSKELLPILQKIAENSKERQLVTALQTLNETLNKNLTKETQLFTLALKTCNWKLLG